MSEIPISPQIWKLAKAILTQKQLQVLELRERHGYSLNQCAITLNTVRSNVREHHRAATRNLLNAIEAAGGDIDYALALSQNGALETHTGRSPSTEEDPCTDASPTVEASASEDTPVTLATAPADESSTATEAGGTSTTKTEAGATGTSESSPASGKTDSAQPRPASEETPEEKTELDRLWKESA